MKFLIVDDSVVMRRIVKKLLRKAGYEEDNHEIFEASCGAEGIELVLRHEPDVVITDYDMPEMTGIEMIKELREKKVDFAFGLATAHCSAEVLMQAIELGARFALQKPFDASKVRRALQSAIGEIDEKCAAASDRATMAVTIRGLREEIETLEVDELRKGAPPPVD